MHESAVSAKRGRQSRDGWKAEQSEHKGGFRSVWELSRILLNNPEVPALLQNYGTESKKKILETMTKAEWRRLKDYFRLDRIRREARCQLSNEEVLFTLGHCRSLL